MLTRRAWLAIAGAAAAWPLPRASHAAALVPRPLHFPADFGSHPDTRIEWWYVTGALDAAGLTHGFQLTFFRSRTALADHAHPSRFAATQLVFAHAAVTDMRARRLRHDQRIARAGFGVAEALVGDTELRLHDWSLVRSGEPGHGRYRAVAASDAAGFGLDLSLSVTQPVLLQGDGGYSRKGPGPDEASMYYSEPQLAVSGHLQLDGRPVAVTGRAWLDHEWSDTLLDPQAVGWDWIGMNLDDGSALTAFRLRRADGSALWAGGSFRKPGQAARVFSHDEVRFLPGRTWSSPASHAAYPVAWTVDTPAGRFQVKARLDDQELDSRASTGSIYWEGLSDLLGADGQPLGRGYLEMTGYAGTLKL